MKFLSVLLSLLAGLALLPPYADAFEDNEVPFCIRAPYDALCSEIPHDQLDFDRNFVYRVLSENAQFPFDNFSWQSFVALNWPVDATGTPMSTEIGNAPEHPRRWYGFSQRDQVFHQSDKKTECSVDTSYPVLETSSFHQASGDVLIDQGLNFVVYDTRMNQAATNYILDNNLTSRRGQSIHANNHTPVAFPLGRYGDETSLSGGNDGALVIKTAWRVLPPEPSGKKVASPYFTMAGRVALAAHDSVDNKPHCLSVRMALVGMHIIQRTLSGNGDRWIWSTFEHVNGAPVAKNARDPNSIYAEPLFPEGCHAPESTDRDFAFYSPDCPDCQTNHIDKQEWRWATEPPYAGEYAQKGGFGTQVVRCWDLFKDTARLNALWHEKLAGTIWQNYFLISTQWRGNYGGGIFGNGEVPRFLTNSTLETFGQYDENGTCIGCHAEARTAVGQDANFSFLLRLDN